MQGESPPLEDVSEDVDMIVVYRYNRHATHAGKGWHGFDPKGNPIVHTGIGILRLSHG